MERSKRTMGLYKGRIVDSGPQRHQLRLLSVEQALEDEDRLEDSVRYIGSKQAIRANERERTQLGKLRKAARYSED